MLPKGVSPTTEPLQHPAADAWLSAGMPTPCWHTLAALGAAPGEGMLTTSMSGLDDPEGERVPAALGAVFDAHVHVFPPRVFDALWRWFEQYGWPIRYKLAAHELLQFLQRRGITRIVALHYAHKAGMARALNRFMAEVVAQHQGVIGTATVYPGEEGAAAILNDAFDAGLCGVKLHCHVQCMAPDDDERMAEVYRTCVERDQVLVMHAGREPKSPAYHCDPYELCSAERIERVLSSYPKLKLCVPHLGSDEYDSYGRLLTRYDNLWLDTTMALAGYLPAHDAKAQRLLSVRPERLLYGSDFPNLPYAWDRELSRIARFGLSDDALERLLWRNADELWRQE